MKKKLSTIILLVIMLVGTGLLVYPTASDWWNSFHQSRAIASYTEAVTNLNAEEYEKMWADAEAYNKELWGTPGVTKFTAEEEEAYESQLNLMGDGIMGYIDIPSINCTLPIYHGTDEAVLQIAVGHVEGSSLPVGGVSSHCVLSGHRGLPSATLFTNLDQLTEGDVFMLDVLNETLTYEVDQILIVEPHEVDSLVITPGQDYCTLVTCTPYGINTHRMLVRGHRIENLASDAAARITSEAARVDPILVAPFVAVPLLIGLMVWLMVSSSRKKKS